MLKNRVLPCLLLSEDSLVKTIQFNKYSYVGDPLNTCRIFNELEVDEMTILDIRASVKGQEPNFTLLKKLASECFMPLSYGGGITSVEQAKQIFSIGYEKIVINSAAYNDPLLISKIANIFGSQSVIVSVDVKKDWKGHYIPYSYAGTVKEHYNLLDWIKKMEELGAGEILLTNINREGTWKGFDLDLIKNVTNQVRVPVIAHGGAGTVKDVENAINVANASAVALGSMVVYQKKDMGVLINYKANYKFKN